MWHAAALCCLLGIVSAQKSARMHLWHLPELTHMLCARSGAEGGGGGLAKVPAGGAAHSGVQVLHAAAGG